jgi:hypothetical protein
LDGIAAFLLERKAAEKKPFFLHARFLLKSAFFTVRPALPLAVPLVQKNRDFAGQAPPLVDGFYIGREAWPAKRLKKPIFIVRD